MRIALLGAVLLLAACGGGHEAAAPSCRLSLAEPPVPTTGEHSLAVRSTCAVRAHPAVGLDGLPFTFVPEGGPRGTHVVLFDKYRCDVRYRALAHEARVDGAVLRMRSSLMDWCPAQAVSTVVHVYLGEKHRRATRRDVLRDAYDGRLDRVYPCAPLRDAIAHLPSSPPVYSDLPERLGRAAAAACGAAIAGVPAGAPRFAVEEVFGAPSSGGPRCPGWRWAPYASSVDGVRVCFAHNRAELVQRALHG